MPARQTGVFLFGLGLIFMVNSGTFGDGFFSYWSKLKTGQDGCQSQNYKLLSLLNLLCNTTQTTSVATRDACYGCFFRAGSLGNGPQQVSSLAECANTYIGESTYAVCIVELVLIANGTLPANTPSPPSFCYTGYCDFVRCVRRINADNLIASCLSENLENRDLEDPDDRIAFYLTSTSCILAKSRCSPYNPITGEYQNQGLLFAKGLVGSVTYYNSLQVSASGDVRLISFPSTVNVASLFCSRYTTLEPATYGNYIC